METTRGAPQGVEAWLGLSRTADGAFELPLAPHLCGPRGPLFGGAALAALISAAERASDRTTVWAHASLERTVVAPAVLRIEVEPCGGGRRIAYLAASASVAGTPVARALLAARDPVGARGERRHWGRRPDAPQPGDCPERRYADLDPDSINGALDVRVASDPRAAARTGRCLLWARVRQPLPACPAGLALLADHVPFVAREALAPDAAAISLDGELRVLAARDVLAALPPGEALLLDVRLSALADGLGHGRVRIWSAGGLPLAEGAQSFRLLPPA